MVFPSTLLVQEDVGMLSFCASLSRSSQIERELALQISTMENEPESITTTEMDTYAVGQQNSVCTVPFFNLKL